MHTVPAFQGGSNGNFQKALLDLAKSLGTTNIVAGLVAASVAGVALSPPGTFQLYHTVNEIPMALFKEVGAFDNCTTCYYISFSHAI